MTAEQNESKNRTVHYRKCEIVADLFTQLHGKTFGVLGQYVITEKPVHDNTPKTTTPPKIGNHVEI